MEEKDKIIDIAIDEHSQDNSDDSVIELNNELSHGDEVKELKRQIEEMQDHLLRTIADSENTRKRLEKEKEESKYYAIFSFAKELVGVMDNLTRTVEYKHSNPDPHFANVIAGINMTKSELENIFKKHGVEAINPPAGELFNYNWHYAVSQVETQEQPVDSIVSTMQVGYKFKERLLRPAMVTVAKALSS